MLHPTTTPLSVPLKDDLTVRTLRSPEDLPRITRLMDDVFGSEMGRLAARMYPVYPGMEPADIFFVENEAGDAVSTLSLVPWMVRYGAATLPIGEMAIVCTDAAYRKRGLVAAQVKYFKQRLAQRGCLLSVIQGIPYFYRQFGYDYAWPLEGGWRLELRDAPETGDDAYTVRAATPADLPALARLYEETVRDLTVHSLRSEEVWRYLLSRSRSRMAVLLAPSSPAMNRVRWSPMCVFRTPTLARSWW